MTRNGLRGASALAIGLMLLVAVARTQSQYEQRQLAIKKLCEQDSAAAKAGGAGAGTGATAGGSGGGAGGAIGGLAGRFGGLGGSPKPSPPPPPPPTPEIALVSSGSAAGGSGGAGASGAGGSAASGGAGGGSLAALLQTSPGATLDLTLRGRFPAGTLFLFDSDFVEVVKQNAAADVYQATLRVSPSAGPGVVQIEMYPLSACAGGPTAPVAVIGGKYVWDLTAADGSRIVLRSDGPGLTLNKEGKFDETVSAESYRPKEAKPHAVTKATLSLAGNGVYSLSPAMQSGDLFGAQNFAELQQKIMQRMVDPTTTDAEKEKLSKDYEAALANYGKNVDAGVERLESTCQGNLTWNGTAAQANLSCGQTATKRALKGTLRSLGQ